MRPDYQPPYDSPLEDEFARNLVKYVGNLDTFGAQVPVQTIVGRFVIDFVAGVDGEVIGLECDGKQFHDKARDEWRDAMILGSGLVTTMYRLRGGDLFYHMEDSLYAVSQRDPQLFSDRGLTNLSTLASAEARAYDYHSGADLMMICYPGTGHGRDPLFTAVERRSRKNPTGKRMFWESLYAFAVEHDGASLDQLIDRYRSQWAAP